MVAGWIVRSSAGSTDAGSVTCSRSALLAQEMPARWVADGRRPSRRLCTFIARAHSAAQTALAGKQRSQVAVARVQRARHEELAEPVRHRHAGGGGGERRGLRDRDGVRHVDEVRVEVREGRAHGGRRAGRLAGRREHLAAPRAHVRQLAAHAGVGRSVSAVGGQDEDVVALAQAVDESGGLGLVPAEGDRRIQVADYEDPHGQ